VQTVSWVCEICGKANQSWSDIHPRAAQQRFQPEKQQQLPPKPSNLLKITRVFCRTPVCLLLPVLALHLGM
jgi:hypothetical protein